MFHVELYALQIVPFSNLINRDYLCSINIMIYNKIALYFLFLRKFIGLSRQSSKTLFQENLQKNIAKFVLFPCCMPEISRKACCFINYSSERYQKKTKYFSGNYFRTVLYLSVQRFLPNASITNIQFQIKIQPNRKDVLLCHHFLEQPEKKS